MYNGRHKIDKNKKAVALRYDASETAPQVVATGKGYVAEKIIENADINEIPVVEDSQLAEELSGLDLGDDIPPELYEVVAQVLIYVSDLDRRENIKNIAAKRIN